MTSSPIEISNDPVDRRRSDRARLSVVRSIGLLDTPVEETFDAMSRLAVALIGAPVSFLSIVDEDRDFYKSQCGFPAPLADSRQMSGRTFCHYALANPAPLVINDTHANPVWRSVPTVESLGVRAYLGVPVIIDDETVGSFCVIDSEPHFWSSTAIEILVQIAKSAAREIKLRTLLLTTKEGAERTNRLAKANEEFWAVIVHDLRSPLQTIRLSVGALGKLADEKQKPFIDRVVRAADSMKQLLDESLSNLTADSASQTQRTPIAVAQLLNDSQDTMELVAERAALRLEVQCKTAAEIDVDYAQMLRVLSNLIGNCVKYCPEGTSVLLSAEQKGGEVVIIVADDGPGMNLEDQGRAFERGWQGTTGRARQDGAGLGLSIVRDLVSSNHGTVSLSSKIGSGTSVAIRLPVGG